MNRKYYLGVRVIERGNTYEGNLVCECVGPLNRDFMEKVKSIYCDALYVRGIKVSNSAVIFACIQLDE